MKILICQLDLVVGDIGINTEKIIESIEVAKQQGADIVCFSEMTICGYAPDDLLLYDSFISDMEKSLHRIVKESAGISVCVGLVRKNPAYAEKGLLNSAAIISDGVILGFHDKWLLPTYDVFNERRYFSPGSSVQVWNINGVKVAVVICEDMWQNAGENISGMSYPLDPIKELSIYKPDLLINLSASPFESRKSDTRLKICEAACNTLGCPVVYVCQVGANGMVIFDGYSLFLDENGKLKQKAKGFAEDFVMVDLHDTSKEYTNFDYDPTHNMFSALTLGVKDYFNKSMHKKAIVGMSGGVDSSVSACIAVEALGAENVTGLYMPTRYSGLDGAEDAHLVAKNLGIKLIDVDIDDIFQKFKDLLGDHIFDNEKREIDVAEENVQARIRGMLLMAFANRFNYLVLSTGTKTELAVGYCTLYGDMVGGLCILGDVLKTECYELAKWINRNGAIIPARVFTKEPSAELRYHQRDEDDIWPSSIIDIVIRGYIEGYKTIDEIATEGGIDRDIVESIVRSIYKFEFKRKQAPPSLRVSKKSFFVGRKKPLNYGASASSKVY